MDQREQIDEKRNSDADPDQDQAGHEVADDAPVARQFEAARIEKAGDRDDLENYAENERNEAEQVVQFPWQGVGRPGREEGQRKAGRTPMIEALP